MDGLAIAAAVIQFIDFAAGLFAKEASIYKSSDGRTTEHRELERITQSLSECHREIQDTLQLTAHDRELTDTERKQKEIGDDCQEVAKELLEVFSRLRTERPLTKWKSFRQALRSCWHDSKVQALEKRLERLQQQMVFAVLNTLRFVACITHLANNKSNYIYPIIPGRSSLVFAKQLKELKSYNMIVFRLAIALFSN